MLLLSPDRFGFVPQFLAWLSRNVGAENPLFFSSFLAIQRAIDEALVRRFVYVRVEIGVPGWGGWERTDREGRGEEKTCRFLVWPANISVWEEECGGIRVSVWLCESRRILLW